MGITVAKTPDTQEKLAILSRDSQYDLACACATRDSEHRKRSKEDKWIYPVVLPGGGTTYLLKTLLSNECVNNCKYCPLRAGSDTRRCSLTPEELAGVFFSYYRARKVSGLFLSSAVCRDPDAAMGRINRAALDLRRAQFRGYIHLKVIPGCSDAAIRQSLALASAVSLNIEAPGEENFTELTSAKNYSRDIIRPIELISRLRRKGAYYEGIKQTTQFVVGAARETDRQIIQASWKLYKELRLNRIYFSAYQRGAGSPELPGENSSFTNGEILGREHRLYQADWLIRKYGFKLEEIPFEANGNLSLKIDPKEAWARQNPGFFPVNINEGDQLQLLRVPGLGQVTVERILRLRAAGVKIKSLSELGRLTKTLDKAKSHIIF